MFIVEGVSGYYFYHLSETGLNARPALCGNKKVMQTGLPIESWGMKTHLNERYCKECEIKYKEGLM